jgi:hypothetical protein
MLRTSTARRLVFLFLVVTGLDDRPVIIVCRLSARATRGLRLGEDGLAVLRCLHGVEGVVILLCLGRCNGAGGGRLLVHALPEGVVGLRWRTLDGGRAHGSWLRLRLMDSGNHHARGGSGVVRRDVCGTFIIITAVVVVANGLKLSSELTFPFFGGLDLSALGSKTSFLFG